MHSISDLTTSSRKTTGDIPPKLVGATTTIVDDKMYVFGGRLVTERKMISDLYVIDLETMVWEKIVPSAGAITPAARYFHSTDAWNNNLVVFGGMGHQASTGDADDLFVLNDVWFFDISASKWSPGAPQRAGSATPSGLGIDAQRNPFDFVPRGRYAHLSSITSSRLFIIGGQDIENLWLDDVCVFDLVSRTWVQRREYPRHTGTYRSIAVAAEWRVRMPDEETRADPSSRPNSLGPPGTMFEIDKTQSATRNFTPSESLRHLSCSADPTEDFPNDIFLYSNYNFTDVKRELEIFTPLPNHEFHVTDRSSSMSGACPPGLRFPSGAICGSHLIFAGTYLSQSYQSFSTWALDLQSMTWTRIDPGAALASGSWFRGCLWSSPYLSTSPSSSNTDDATPPRPDTHPSKSKFVVFGDRKGNIVEDYNRRLLSWEDVVIIDLEVFGIYQQPKLALDVRNQEMGLAALEEELFTDFEVVCDDGRSIGCSRGVLDGRWRWFRDQRRLFGDTVDGVMKAVSLTSYSSSSEHSSSSSTSMSNGTPTHPLPTPDPRLTPRTFNLSEPYPVTLALIQYLYTLTLLTPLQYAPAVLSQLLVLATTYDIPHLRAIVIHAMHEVLSPQTSLGVYEVATLCSCQSLQIRALKYVMSSSRRMTTSTSRTAAAPPSNHSNLLARANSGSGTDSGSASGGGGGNAGTYAAARPRGMSDLRSLRSPVRGPGAGDGFASRSGPQVGRQVSDTESPRRPYHHTNGTYNGHAAVVGDAPSIVFNST